MLGLQELTPVTKIFAGTAKAAIRRFRNHCPRKLLLLRKSRRMELKSTMIIMIVALVIMIKPARAIRVRLMAKNPAGIFLCFDGHKWTDHGITNACNIKDKCFDFQLLRKPTLNIMSEVGDGYVWKVTRDNMKGSGYVFRGPKTRKLKDFTVEIIEVKHCK